MATKEKPNGIRIETNYHQKIENNSLYKKLNELFFNTVEEHTCAQDEGQSYTEEEDGLFVGGTHEAGYFIATWVFAHLKEAYGCGWQSRNRSLGKSRAIAMLNKKMDYDAFKAAIINDINSLNPTKNSPTMTPLPESLAAMVKKEAEATYDDYNDRETFVEGALFMYSLGGEAGRWVEMVRLWHDKFGVHIGAQPGLIGMKRFDMRQNILQEEVDELKAAYEAGELHTVADAVCDIIYVVLGTAIEFGLHEKLPELF